jgi:hypothetical protein
VVSEGSPSSRGKSTLDETSAGGNVSGKGTCCTVIGATGGSSGGRGGGGGATRLGGTAVRSVAATPGTGGGSVESHVVHLVTS